MKQLLKNLFPLLLGILLFSKQSFAQLKTYQVEQIDSLQKIEKRMVLVFISTDWCRYCQTMKNTTFKNDKIVDQINKRFYFVDLNGEEKRTVVFKNHFFKYKPTGHNTGTHELAEQLGTVEGNIAYPTLCFLNTDSEIIFQYPQYIEHTDLMAILARLK